MRGKLVAVGALVAGITLGTMGSALGGNGLPPITVDPASGTPGTTFTVSGEECFFEGNSVDTGPLVEVTVDFPTPLVGTTNADLEAGAWSVELTVPVGTPPGTYSVTADCQNEPPLESTGDVGAAQLYPEGATFTVEQVAAVNGPVTPVPDATPAPAVAGAPRFTG